MTKLFGFFRRFGVTLVAAFLVSAIGGMGVWAWSQSGDFTVSGNMGIGTESPSEKLEVAGTVKAENFLISDRTQIGAELAISGGNNEKITLENGIQLYIYDSRNTWEKYQNLPSYLLGTEGTDKINGSDVTLTLSDSTTCYLIRKDSWSGVDTTGWSVINSGVEYITGQGSNFTIYEKVLSAGNHTLDIHSAMYACDTNTIDFQVLDVTESDPIFVAWEKSYDDLTDKPDLSIFLTSEDISSCNSIPTPISCSQDQILQWEDSNWICAAAVITEERHTYPITCENSQTLGYTLTNPWTECTMSCPSNYAIKNIILEYGTGFNYDASNKVTCEERLSGTFSSGTIVDVKCSGICEEQ